MKNSYNNLRGLIIGCGSIGERHLHNIKKIGVKDIAILDINKLVLNNLSKKYSVKKFLNLDDALLESWHIMKRAGAQFIISYGARKSKELGIRE